MSLPTTEPLLPDDDSLPPARRRRRRRLILPAGVDERAAYLNELSRQLTPSLDFFVFSLVCGLLLGIAVLLDQPPVYLLAAVAAPFIAPVMGICLATVVGAPNFFLRSLGSYLIGSALVFGMGALAGLAGRYWQSAGGDSHVLSQYTQVSLPGLLVACLAGLLTAYLLARNPRRLPLGMNVLLAYALYLPLGVIGFMLTSGQAGSAWYDGLTAWLVNLAAIVLFGSLTFILIGVRPRTALGFIFGSALIIFCLAAAFAMIYFKYIPQLVQPMLAAVPPTPTETSTASITITPSATQTPTATRTSTGTASPTLSPTGQTATKISQTPTITPSPSRTATNTFTAAPSPTAVLAVIKATEGNGAVFRADPYFGAEPVEGYESLLNGTLVLMFEEVTNSDGVWRHVRLPNKDIDGWILQSLMITATPKP